MNKATEDFLLHRSQIVLNKMLLKHLDANFWEMAVNLNISSIAVKLANTSTLKQVLV